MTVDSKQFQAELDRIIESQLPRAVIQGLVEIGDTVAIEATRLAPVDTGKLRASISVEEEGQDVYVVAGVEHAIFVHEGTRSMEARPFLTDAMEAKSHLFDDLMKEALRNG